MVTDYEFNLNRVFFQGSIQVNLIESREIGYHIQQILNKGWQLHVHVCKATNLLSLYRLHKERVWTPNLTVYSS